MKLKFGFSLKNNVHFPPSTVVLGKEKYFLEGIAKGIRSKLLPDQSYAHSSHNFNIVKA